MAQDSIIQVLVAIDAESIVGTLGTNTDPKQPVQVTNANLIWMITRQGNAVSGNAGSELNLSADTDDIIRWRESTLSLNSDYSALLYEFDATDGPSGLISPPMPLLTTVEAPLPDPNAPLLPTRQQVKNYFWQTTVLNPGSMTYHFKFMVIGRDGAVAGYYWWDPFITITA